MIRWLVIGASGRLGRDTAEVLAGDPDAWVVATNRASLDITDGRAVHAAVTGFDVVVNAAAWTDVDAAEAREAAAHRVNAAAVAGLAAACGQAGARLLHVSTDYVFGAEPPPAGGAYPEDAATAPVNAYGRGKEAGERAVRALLPDAGYVVRTAWLFGEHGSNFLTTMLRLAAVRETVDVVDDQYGQPTWSWAVAERLWELGRAAVSGQAPPGVYHATAAGRTSWYGFAREIYGQAGLDPDRVRPVPAVPRPARRPAETTLSHGRWAAAGLAPPQPWEDMLRRALAVPTLAALRRAC